MKILDILKYSPQGISFEFFPPKTENGKTALTKTVTTAAEFKPLYVSMTHGAAGSSRQYTVDAVKLLLTYPDLTVMPHLAGLGLKFDQVKDLLNEYKLLGIENIMALRGDLPQGQDNSFLQKTNKDFVYAANLVKFIKRNYDFCVGAAVYPEGHIESKDLNEDLEYTKQKIDQGVDFCVTQMFFDNKFFYDLRDRFKRKNINLPVLPGILPLTDIVKVKQFISICRTTIPKDIETKMTQHVNQPKEMEAVGLDFTIKQCRDLISQGVKQIHFFTLNKPEVIKKILEAIG